MYREFLLPILFLFAACTGSKLPEQYSESHSLPHIYPDIIGTTVPCNICPLTFSLLPSNPLSSSKSIARIHSGEEEVLLKGPDFRPSMGQWKRLVGTGSEIEVEVYQKDNTGWTRFQPFSIHVSPDSIDPWLAYRLISPSYVTYEDLTICQRSLETYEEKVIYGNMMNSNEEKGHCINCHAFQQGNPERMQFHVRQDLGGTIILCNGKFSKVNLKTDSTISSGVYPAWHPTKKLIAYSTNTTSQTFHTRDLQKVEVQDTYSDLILYDIERNTVQALPCDSNQLDCFPAWSPDGRWLYFCSAQYTPQDSTLTRQFDMVKYPETLHYNLYRCDSENHYQRELVYDAASQGQSATLPRISPDGRWLLFTQAPYGVFHIWHTKADLYLMDLENGTVKPLSEVNSPQVESYHSWSSSGKWIVLSSRRDDGNFTRPFFAHIDAEGHATKPFELPTRNPLFHKEFLRSYNVPEFLKAPVSETPQEIGRVVREEAQQAAYESVP